MYSEYVLCVMCGVLCVFVCAWCLYIGVCMCLSKDLVDSTYVCLIFETGSYTGS